MIIILKEGKKMKNILVLVVSLMLVMTSSVFVFAADKGFGDDGNNLQARVFHGSFSAELPDLHLAMKWSKDMNCKDYVETPIGAWVTNHFTWYTNSKEEGNSWYGQMNPMPFGTGEYRMEEFLKIMKVSDDPDMWTKWLNAGAWDSGLGGYYDSGVPRLIVFQDELKIYDAATGELLSSMSFVSATSKGLGKPIF